MALHEQRMAARRGGASVEYIKNLVLKYMELEQHRTVKVPVFAVLQLACCAFPGRAWRLRAARYSRSEAPATN